MRLIKSMRLTTSVYWILYMYVVNSCLQEELLSIRMKFEVGDVTQHLSRKLMKRRDKRVST